MKNRYFIILTLSFFLINLLSIRSLGQDNNALARKVVDEKGNSIPYAEIRCEIAQKVITADENGNFSIKITPDEVLLVEAEGFESRILDITALATGESI